MADSSGLDGWFRVVLTDRRQSLPKCLLIFWKSGSFELRYCASGSPRSFHFYRSRFLCWRLCGGCSLSYDWSILDCFGRARVHFSLFILIALKKSPPFVRKQARTTLPRFRPCHPGSVLKLRTVRGQGTKKANLYNLFRGVASRCPTLQGREFRTAGRFVSPARRDGRASGMTRRRGLVRGS